MDDDQQFCLRWNNHQSTLISVFDTLLENETLVDCTLAAEGKFLKAHKVVLSACSPYFATLLSEQYDKHPIFILKDVKYQELRAMMDYMYRGEVNISQDQLAALLKAAESLQIKGLSDNRTGSGNSSSGLGGVSQQQQQQKISAEQQHKHISVPGKLMTGSASAGYTLEQTKRSRIGPSSIDSQDLSGSREGSSSPTSRRRKKVRRRSIENVLADNHDNSNSSQVIQGGSSSIVPTTNATGTITAMLPMIGSGVGGTTTTISSSVASTITVAAQQQLQQQQQQASAATAAANIITANVTKKTESVKMGGNTDAMNAAVTAVDNIQDENAADSIDEKEMIMKEKQNHKRPKHQHEGVVATSTGKDEIVIEPKSEYDDEGNDETVEDLTLDDEEMGLEDLDHNAGPSHGGEGSSQGYAQWQVDRSQDEVFMAAQEAQQRDPQGEPGGGNSNEIRRQNLRLKSSPYSSPAHAMLPFDRLKKEDDEFDAGMGGSSCAGDINDDDAIDDDDDDNQPCDLRLTTSAVQKIKELVSIAQQQHATQSSLLSSAAAMESLQSPSMGALTAQSSTSAGGGGSTYVAGLAGAIAAVSSSSSNLPPISVAAAAAAAAAAAHLSPALLGYSTIKRSGSFSSATASGSATGAGLGAAGSSSVTGTAAGISGPSNSGVGGGSGISPFSGGSSSALTPGTSSSALGTNVGSASAGGPGNTGGGGVGVGGGVVVGTGNNSGGWGGAYTCDRCGNSYARPHSLNRHVRFECGVEPKFECPICHKKSKHKHNLVLHMRTHQNR
ncbi:longitudinals lacking protein, isoforms F/I/K/T isoform X4 [Eupeodes corollae]|uniref:longitudinals lacking protein, isoforms F/I/K/T isoform X4 n=1 Tax=Eupeodes corollae TaxID=290404 RepID=UPI002492476D|nr:longitudinals lacking protein, isoforms F/I/K/T isoform X4 [Eupeodes corollae]